MAAAAAVLLAALAPAGLAGVGGPGPEAPVRVVALLREGARLDLDGLAAVHGARVLDAWPLLGGAVLGAPSPDAAHQLVGALLARPEVRAAELDRAWTLHAYPNDPRSSQQWGPANLGAFAAWDAGFGSRAVRIAILDTGADLDHEDLAANICGGRNFLSPGQPPEDDHDHGTHVAGIAGAVANNGRGIAGMSQSCLLIGKVCDADGACFTSTTGAAIEWALDPDRDAATRDGAHVVSMSFGSVFHSEAMLVAMQRAWGAGLLLVASAGNAHCTLVEFPAAYEEVIAVGALQQLPAVARHVTTPLGREAIVRAPFSNCGPEVELAAPGVRILSSVRANQYEFFDGTSMATPFVSGVAALVKAANPALTNAQLRCVLDATAQDLGPDGRDLEHGFGKVRADRAVQAAAHGAGCEQPVAPLGLWGEDP